jgi:acyl-CoA thioesterase-1
MSTPRMRRLLPMVRWVPRLAPGGHRWIAPTVAAAVAAVVLTSAVSVLAVTGDADRAPSPGASSDRTLRRAAVATTPCPAVTAGETLPAATASTRADRRPVLAVVGASFTAGYGARQPSEAFPQQLGRLLGWRVSVSADPGAGYLNPGHGHLGPLAALTDRLDLVRLHPAVVLVQSGHNDIGTPLGALAVSVRSLINQIHCEAPQARLGVITVFISGDRPTSAALATDRTIVAAARQADPQVMVFDPLAQHWHFPRITDQLHPSPEGHRWIAARIAATLRADARRGSRTPVVG